MKNNLFPTIRLLVSGAAAAVLLGLGGGAHAQAYVNATVGGELAPGVYGRINIGNAPPPPLLYAEPVIIQRPAVVVPRAPIYMYVPPGHAKNWSKHCARYNACSRCILCRSRLPAAATRTAGPMAGTTAAGTMIIATMTAMTTIAVPGAERAVARAMDIGTKSLYFAGFAPAQRRGRTCG